MLGAWTRAKPIHKGFHKGGRPFVHASGKRSSTKHQASSYWAMSLWGYEAMRLRGYRAMILLSYYVGAIFWQFWNIFVFWNNFKACVRYGLDTLTHIWTIVGQSWDVVLHCLGSFRSMAEQHRDHVWSILGQFWFHVGIIMEPLWDHFWKCCNMFGATLEEF